jgi:hypothetical protein
MQARERLFDIAFADRAEAEHEPAHADICAT